MLNEKKEYEEYSFDLENEYESKKNMKRLRLKNATIVKGALAGLRRPLTIIARKFIFEVFQESGESINNIIYLTKLVLELWCRDVEYKDIDKVIREEEDELGTETKGGAGDEYRQGRIEGFETLKKKYKPFVENLVGWMPAYLRRFKESKGGSSGKAEKDNKENGNDDKIEKLITKLMYGRRKALYTVSHENSSRNDYNQVTFEKAVADALEAGPLRDLCLVCYLDKDQNFNINHAVNNKENAMNGKFLKCTKKKDYESGKGLFSEVEIDLGNSRNRSNLDIILKFTAAYLLSDGKRKDGYRDVKQSDIINWAVTAFKKEDVYSQGFCHFRYNKACKDKEKIWEDFFKKIEVSEDAISIYEGDAPDGKEPGQAAPANDGNMGEAEANDASSGQADKPESKTSKKKGNIGGSNITMIRMNPAWISDYGWTIIEKGQLEEEQKRAESKGKALHWFSDPGSGQNLEYKYAGARE